MKLKPLQASLTLSPSLGDAGGPMTLANVIPKACCNAGLTQDEVALHMRTTQDNAARLCARGTSPSIRTLNKFALAERVMFTIVFLSPLTTESVPEVRKRSSANNFNPTC